ncbi:methyltransferase/phosphopantetheine adenylyltransferase [Lacticaseibacillus paracasei]|nr:methyltransferase/phosphopantetheine adenylyltransferase [Lacticaseibacillus paracasei]
MRVISGAFRGLRLTAVAGNQTRPTADKVKESMFNMLGPYFDGGQALDLYAGTGALGIEAVSRGMVHATLVDRQYAAIKTIKTNLALTKQPEHFTVLKQPVNKAIRQFAEAGQQFDLIMMDPPYAQQQVLAQLAAFISTNLLRPGARVLVETGMDVTYPDEIPGYIKLRRQTYGVAQVLILERSEENNAKKIAVFPGSFDPFTNGHLDTVKRASRLFDEVVVAAMTNTSKKPLFSSEEKLALISESTAGLPNVKAMAAPKRLTVEFARSIGARFMIRGIRNVADFGYEADIATVNHDLDPEIETVFLLADKQYDALSSTIIKEVAAFGGDVHRFVPAPVEAALYAKLGDAHQTK